MITIKEFPNQTFETKEQMFKALRDNKSSLISQKKMITKEADAVVNNVIAKNSKGDVVKADSVSFEDINTLKMQLIINTTNLLDSHSDVHDKGIWKKSLQESKAFYLLQEHKMSFSNIITDKVNAKVITFGWKDLGANYPGDTEALVFEVEVDKTRNPFMFEQYAKGFVKNHSVGMRYVKMELAINSDSKYDVEEKEVWDANIDKIANKEVAEGQGYFWLVKEAKVIEGSAVPMGSNVVTPVYTIESKSEPLADTHVVDKTDTQEEPSLNDIIITNFKL